MSFRRDIFLFMRRLSHLYPDRDIFREIGVESTPDFSLVKMRTCPAPVRLAVRSGGRQGGDVGLCVSSHQTEVWC